MPADSELGFVREPRPFRSAGPQPPWPAGWVSERAPSASRRAAGRAAAPAHAGAQRRRSPDHQLQSYHASRRWHRKSRKPQALSVHHDASFARHRVPPLSPACQVSGSLRGRVSEPLGDAVGHPRPAPSSRPGGAPAPEGVRGPHSPRRAAPPRPGLRGSARPCGPRSVRGRPGLGVGAAVPASGPGGRGGGAGGAGPGARTGEPARAGTAGRAALGTPAAAASRRGGSVPEATGRVPGRRPRSEWIRSSGSSVSLREG